MKKRALTVSAILFLLGGVFFIPGNALSHDVNFSLGINMSAPPPVIVTRPPTLYVIPGTPVYYVPEVERQLYFYSGNWYRLYDGYWFRAAYHNGPWMYLSPSSVPTVFIDISPAYYVIPPRQMYVPYWKQKIYWKDRERRHCDDRDEWDGHDHRNRDWKHKDWKDEKRDRKDYGGRFRS